MTHIKGWVAHLLFGMLLLHQGVAFAGPSFGQVVELIIENGETTIAGTLAMPYEPQTGALVIMLSGSGPQDRDETLDGFSVFLHLAKHLSEQGIPSFRFDDRGVGGSSGNFGQSTLSDHSNDVIRILDYFSEHKRYRFRRFILLGHSQGGIVAGHVAATRPDVDNVILMAAPSVPLLDIVLYQVRQEYARLQIKPSLLERGVSAHHRLIWAIHSCQPIDVALRHFNTTLFAILAAAPENHNQSQAALRALAAKQTQEYRAVYALPSLTSFLFHDPAGDLAGLTTPVLALFGDKDRQVTIGQNKDPMENALLQSGVDYTMVTFEKANHYFPSADTGSREEYARLDKNFVPTFLRVLSDWITNADTM